MLKIRSEQMVALRAALDRDFIGQMVRHLRAAGAGEAAKLDDRECEARVTAALSEGRRLGIRSDGAMVKFIAMTFELGPDFTDDAEVAALFRASAPDAAVYRLAGRRRTD